MGFNNYKAQFVKSLEAFYKKECRNVETIHRLDYVEEDFEEWVYVTYQSYSQKRFCVTGDSEQDILTDFVKYLQNYDAYDWLLPNDEKFRAEFMEGIGNED